jgi:hypothetical protein
MELAGIKHGRLGMIVIAGYVMQEYVTGLGVVDETPTFFHPLFHLTTTNNFTLTINSNYYTVVLLYSSNKFLL